MIVGVKAAMTSETTTHRSEALPLVEMEDGAYAMGPTDLTATRQVGGTDPLDDFSDDSMDDDIGLGPYQRAGHDFSEEPVASEEMPTKPSGERSCGKRPDPRHDGVLVWCVYMFVVVSSIAFLAALLFYRVDN